MTNTLTVQDVFPPVWSGCPGNITWPATTTNASAVFWTPPIASDNQMVVSNTSNFNPGDVFAITRLGSNSTRVIYTAVDEVGLTSQCTFTVVVRDQAPPTITCRANSTNVPMSPGLAVLILNESFAYPLVLYDNDGPPTLLPLAQTEYAAGTHTITRTAVDPSGNTNSCSFTITVADNEPPSFSNCAGAIKSQDKIASKDSNGMFNVAWDKPTYSDNVAINEDATQLLDVTDGTAGKPILTNISVVLDANSVATRYLRVVVYDTSGNSQTCSIKLNIASASASASQTSSDNSSSSTSTTLIIGVAVGASVLVVIAIIAAMYQRHRRKALPHDFTGILAMMENMPTSEDGLAVPREIKRDHVRIVSNLGKGNFGSVDKALLDEQRALGIPAYLVAVKQLLSKHNHDRLSLLEEAATMAQFDHPHCVRLIGVVTVGDPLMVSIERISCVVLCCVVSCCIVLCCVLLCCVVLCFVVFCFVVLCCVVVQLYCDWVRCVCVCVCVCVSLCVCARVR